MYLFHTTTLQWKTLVKQKVSNYLSKQIKQEITLFTLKYIGEIHVYTGFVEYFLTG